jgi:hypothetical protein
MEPTALPPQSRPSPTQSPFYPLNVLVHHIYAGNPFYPISAALVLVGLHAIFYDAEAAAAITSLSFNSWLLLGVLGAFVGLLAVTAIVIVRLGGVWDDARTIALTLMLLFVAISVSFDKMVLTHSATMIQVLGVGLALSLAVAELVIRGLRIRLPLVFRGPLYLGLGLFFLYPMLLLHLLDKVFDGDPVRAIQYTMLGILLFPVVAAAVTLLLLPAAWIGPRAVANNGSPWPWPYYPWSAFVVLGVAVVLRAYWLTISFHPHPGTADGFRPYFLLPFFLSVCVVMFEAARSVGAESVQRFALVAPLASLLVIGPGPKNWPPYEQFLRLYIDWLGTPIRVAWWGLVAFYIYAWCRRVRAAEVGVVAMLAIGSFIGPNTLDSNTLRFPNVIPLFLCTVLLTMGAILRPVHSARWLLAASAAIGTLTVALWRTPFMVRSGMVPLHLVLGTVLMLALVCRDSFAVVLKRVGAVGLAAAGFTGMLETLAERGPGGVDELYLVAVASVAWSFWYVTRGDLQLTAAIVTTACALGPLAIVFMTELRRVRNPRGLSFLFAGALSFAAGLAISACKAGWRRRYLG